MPDNIKVTGTKKGTLQLTGRPTLKFEVDKECQLSLKDAELAIARGFAKLAVKPGSSRGSASADKNQ